MHRKTSDLYTNSQHEQTKKWNFLVTKTNYDPVKVDNPISRELYTTMGSSISLCRLLSLLLQRYVCPFTYSKTNKTTSTPMRTRTSNTCLEILYPEKRLSPFHLLILFNSATFHALTKISTIQKMISGARSTGGKHGLKKNRRLRIYAVFVPISKSRNMLIWCKKSASIIPIGVKYNAPSDCFDCDRWTSSSIAIPAPARMRNVEKLWGNHERFRTAKTCRVSSMRFRRDVMSLRIGKMMAKRIRM